MMLTKGMTAEQMDAMIAAMEWEVLESDEYENEFDGSLSRELVIWQEDHAVAVYLSHEVISELQYVPAWML